MSSHNSVQETGSKRALTLAQRCGLVHACMYMACCKCFCCKRCSKKNEAEDEGAIFETSALLLGCSGSGKSTLLYQLSKPSSKRGTLPTVDIEPTNGFSIKQIKYKNNMISFWEVGGTPALRKYWSKYATTTFFQVLVYVVDRLR